MLCTLVKFGVFGQRKCALVVSMELNPLSVFTFISYLIKNLTKVFGFLACLGTRVILGLRA
jgi:hypothetical protein